MTLAVLCPGQGAQHAGMLDLAATDPAGRAAFDAVTAALADDPRRWLASDSMFANANAQPLICVAQGAQWEALRDALPRPAAVAGYSVGELSSYGVAGAIGIADVARLARERAAAMDVAASTHPGGLVAVRGLSRRAIDAQCAQSGTYPAIVVGDDAFVVGGAEATLADLVGRCKSLGVDVRPLRVGVAAHTPLLADAVLPFRDALQASALGAPAIPVVAGIDADLVTTRERAIETLAAQVARAIEWAQCLDTLHELGCRVMLELGPGRALSRMARERFDDVEARAVEEFSGLGAVAQWVARRTR